jgi:hypothetical protein
MVVGLLLKLLTAVISGFGTVIGRDIAQDLEKWRERRHRKPEKDSEDF